MALITQGAIKNDELKTFFFAFISGRRIEFFRIILIIMINWRWHSSWIHYIFFLLWWLRLPTSSYHRPDWSHVSRLNDENCRFKVWRWAAPVNRETWQADKLRGERSLQKKKAGKSYTLEFQMKKCCRALHLLLLSFKSHLESLKFHHVKFYNVVLSFVFPP